MKNSLQLSNLEIQMMKEVFQVFSKFKGKTRTFGVQLAHSHFPLAADEILYETHDPVKRRLHVAPIKIKKFKTAPLATAWHTIENGNIEVCMFCCDGAGGGRDDASTSR